MIIKNGRLYMIQHPYINNIYLERDDTVQKPQNVLVIETDIDFRASAFNARDERLMELLADLNELQMMAEKNMGEFTRVDIRTSWRNNGKEKAPSPF